MDCKLRFRSLGLAALAALLGVAPVHAATKKKSATAASSPAPRETVYVHETPPVSESEVEKSKLRPYGSAYGISAAIYAADVLGSSPYGYFSYDFYPLPATNFFMEANGGAGFAQSSFSYKVIGAREFDPNLLIDLELLAGFNLQAPKNTPGSPGGLYPYLVAGVTGIYQGSVPNVGLVLGFGQRVPVPWMAEMG